MKNQHLGKFCVIIQKYYRRYRQMKQYKKMKEGIIKIKSFPSSWTLSSLSPLAPQGDFLGTTYNKNDKKCKCLWNSASRSRTGEHFLSCQLENTSFALSFNTDLPNICDYKQCVKLVLSLTSSVSDQLTRSRRKMFLYIVFSRIYCSNVCWMLNSNQLFFNWHHKMPRYRCKYLYTISKELLLSYTRVQFLVCNSTLPITRHERESEGILG